MYVPLTCVATRPVDDGTHGRQRVALKIVNWPSILTVGLSSLMGSLLAIFATPILQHHIWKRQRRAELKLKTVDTVNTLTAEFIQQWISANGASQEYSPALAWHERFSAAEAAVKSLFADDTYKVFKNLQNRIEPKLGTIGSPYPNVNAFIDARDVAMKALYNEVI